MRLLVSCFDPNLARGGGLFEVTESDAVQVSVEPCTGLAVGPHGMARVLWMQGPHTYVEVNGERFPLEDVSDPHGLRWDGDELVLVDTNHNRLLWLNQQGGFQREWKPRPYDEPDSWHLNCLATHQYGLAVSCFGDYRQTRGWAGRLVDDRAGMILAVPSGKPLVKGLVAPHSIVCENGTWTVVNSGAKEVVRIRAGQEELLAKTEGWPRGMAMDDDFVYLGISALRAEPGGFCGVVVYDRETWAEIQRVPLEGPDIYQVVLWPGY